MANVYVRSGAGGSNNGSSWANAYTTLGAAFAAKSAGDNFWVSEDHAESTASTIFLTSPGTISSPCTAICVNHSGSVPPVSADLRTTATITTTTGSGIAVDNYTYFYGVSLICSGNLLLGYNAAAGVAMQSCKLTLTTSGNYLYLGAENPQPSTIKLTGCTFKFSDTAQGLRCRGGTIYIGGGSVDGAGSVPDYLMAAASPESVVTFEGVDLSAASGALISAVGTSHYTIIVRNCKVSTGSLAATPACESEFYVINCDSGATNYRTEQISYRGLQAIETTIVRTGGATNGTTPVSWKIITSANSTWLIPFSCIPMTIWNDTTAANVTVTVYGIWGGGAVPNNDDIWIEVSYPGSSSTPIATINTANTKADFLATGTGQASDSSTWGGSTTKFKMSATLSAPQPAMKGPIYVTVKAAKASSTFYVDPKIVLS